MMTSRASGRSANRKRRDTASWPSATGERPSGASNVRAGSAAEDFAAEGAEGTAGAAGAVLTETSDAEGAGAGGAVDDAAGAEGAGEIGARAAAAPASGGMPSLAASSGQRASWRTQTKSGLAATSGFAPRFTIRSSITSASSGRPLNDWARARRNIRSVSLRRPFWIVRQARSWNVSKSPRAAAASACARQSAASAQAGAAGVCMDTKRTSANSRGTGAVSR